MKLLRSLPCFILLHFVYIAGAQTIPFHLEFKTTGELQRFLSYSKDRMPLISAHRGGPQKKFPENALETFQQSILFQPLIIECDIALSKDSVLVLMHDNRLDRTSTGKGVVADYTFDELQQFRLKDNYGDTTAFRIPRLDDVLLWGKNKVIFTLDIKRGVPYAKVVEAVRRCNAETGSVIITYNAEQAAEVYHLAPELMMSVSIQNKEDLLRLNAKGIPDNRMIAFIGVREGDKELYDLLHEHHIQAILGTMGNLDKQAETKGNRIYYDMIEKGADILSTNNPQEAGSMMQQYIKDKQLRSAHIKINNQK